MSSRDFNPDDLDGLLRDSERSLRELTSMIGELQSISGAGESRSGAVTATVDANGRLDQLKLAPRASRMELDELTEEIVQAVRAAQDDQTRRTMALIPVSPQLGNVSLEEIQHRFDEIQDSFTRDMHERMADLEAIRRRSLADD
ncbi:DNA-binding protein YbaB [Nonomuraea thailandensis]|uniref:DNA-binding protein YbaB n=1 Tax=Nonomuraea thailandensis TaxID=1188745 RepID=A0A9X2K9L0_9ACTN|nr:YbaB/EbfC family nucleoid-associated protein [Nonomuraea thailandensis]MCP2361946.1 DNA-binding protein YbaB [Nonomuraea thailandensis]